MDTYLDSRYLVGKYESLNAHLAEILPVIAKFSEENGFCFVNRKALGRYPRVRIKRVRGQITDWYDLSMEFTPEGRQYEDFEPGRLYSLGAGASFVQPASEGSRARMFSFAKWLFENMPYSQVRTALNNELIGGLPEISQWDSAFLEKNGQACFLLEDGSVDQSCIDISSWFGAGS